MQCRDLEQAAVSEAAGAMEEALDGKALFPLAEEGIDPPTVLLMGVLTQ